MYGRIGGSQGSEGMKAFSDGFGESTLDDCLALRCLPMTIYKTTIGWANFDLGVGASLRTAR